MNTAIAAMRAIASNPENQILKKTKKHNFYFIPKNRKPNLSRTQKSRLGSFWNSISDLLK